MTFDELHTLIKEADWFSKLGQPGVPNEFVPISTLAPWADQSTDDDALEEIADQMEWLPSSRDQDDPVHGPSLEQRAEAQGNKQQFSKLSLDVYKYTLVSLRDWDGFPNLKVGPHDFSEAARGAALFAVRRAALEVLLGEPGFWCRLMKVYHAGHWPCGILPNKKVVVL